MKTLKYVLLCAALFILGGVATAQSSTFITSAQVKDETLTAADLGPDVTRIKVVKVTIMPGDDTWSCDDESDESTCHPDEGSGAGTISRTVNCPSGNVTSGGLKLANADNGYNLDLHASYPESDHGWTFSMYNTGPDPITVQLRIICI